MLVVMAVKPCNLVLKNMNEKGSNNSSETSTPEEYLTPSGDSVLISDNSAFSFPDLDRESQYPIDRSLDNAAKLADEVTTKNLANFDENLNCSKAKRTSVTNSTTDANIDCPNMNNNLTRLFETVDKDVETKPTKLKPEKQIQSISKSSEAAVEGDLTVVRRKLEERRRKMELEKKRQEQQWCRQRQAISKEAYSALFGKELENPGEFHLPSGEKARAKWNDNKAQSSGYYRHDSAIAMERLFANEESSDGQLVGGTLDRNFLRKQKAAQEMASVQQGKPTLDRKKTSSFKESSSSKNKNSEHRNNVDPNYGISLDRLNSSLSELQGEIMRLSLQQDHIKNLVSLGDSPNHSAPSQKITSSSLNSSRQDPVPSRMNVPEEAARVRTDCMGADQNTSKGQSPLKGSAFRRYTEGRGYHNNTGQEDNHEDFDREYLLDHDYQEGFEEMMNQQGNIPYPHPAVIPALSPFPFLHSYHQPPFYSYGLSPYYQPFATHPHYNLRSRQTARNLDYRMKEGQLKRDLSLGGIPDLRSASRRQEPSRRDSFSASRSSYSYTRGDHRLPRPSSVVSDYFPTSHISYDRSSLDRDAVYFQPRVTHNPSLSDAVEDHQSRRASQGFYAPEPRDDPSFSASTFPCDRDQNINDAGTIQSGSDLEEELFKSIQQPEFFVVNLEDAKRPKPEIGLQRKSKMAKENSTTLSFQTSEVSMKLKDKSENNQEDSTESEIVTINDNHLKSDDEKTETGSVGFVIEDTILDPSISAEVEKRKNKLAELHQRRKEELEAKKDLINKDQQAQKEQLRLKEEKALKKKTEEKQRRDMIFQKYLQRKAEKNETNSDDDSVKHLSFSSTPPKSSVSKLRPPSHGIKKQRPQSQLVVSCPGRETNPDFSDDCSIIITAVKHPLTAEPKVQPISDVGSISDEKRSAQERFSRFLSCGSEGERAEDGSGLKLFVKPNQKSNRSIIINAIKDCCLAGVVNQEMKNKVLEEVNRSESKHFVVLFRDAGLQYKGLYSYNPDKQEVFKIHGVGPKQLSDKSMEKFFKYNSGSKNFSEVTSTKHLSSTIDGVTILSCLWSRRQPSCTMPRKTT